MAETPPTPSAQESTQRSNTLDTGMNKPGDVIINQLLLNTISSDTPVDLKPFLMEFHLHEDIFSPTLQGSVIIRDSLNLVGRLPIVGDEVLTVDIQTPWGELGGYNANNLGKFDPINKIQKSFSVYAVKDRKLNNDREQYYQIFFCSMEASTDNVTKLCQKYVGTTDEIAAKIFEETMLTPRIFTNKQVIENFSEGAKTEFVIADTPHESMITFVPPMWTPIQCLSWLAKRSIGSKFKSPTFMFFETTKAFYFASIESLVTRQLENGDIYSSFVYNTNLDNLSTVSALTKGFQTIEALQFLTNLDVLQGQDLGHFASTVHSFDMVKKKYQAYYYDHGYNYNKYTHMEDGKLDAATGNYTFPEPDAKKPYKMIFPINVLRSSDNKPFVATVNPGVLDSTEDSIDLHPEEFIAQRNSSLMDLTTLRLQITVPGRTDAEVGRLIKLYYPSVGEKTQGDSEAVIWDQFLTGIYMITAIHHQVTPLRHTMYMEISKDSYAKPLYDVEETGGTTSSPTEPATTETAPATPAPAGPTPTPTPATPAGVTTP